MMLREYFCCLFPSNVDVMTFTFTKKNLNETIGESHVLKHPV